VLFVHAIEATLVHEFHADADVGLGHKCTIERNDVRGTAVVHYLKLAENLFADDWFRVDQNNLAPRGISSMILYAVVCLRTFFAMICCVGMCSTLDTDPPLPWPSSLKVRKSSTRKSIAASGCPISMVANRSWRLWKEDWLGELLDSSADFGVETGRGIGDRWDIVKLSKGARDLDKSIAGGLRLPGAIGATRVAATTATGTPTPETLDDATVGLSYDLERVSTCTASDLKLRFFRTAGLDISSPSAKQMQWRQAPSPDLHNWEITSHTWI
jgi:hypothetical protein